MNATAGRRVTPVFPLRSTSICIPYFFLIVSTTWVFGLFCAFFTVVNCPVSALRPIFDLDICAP